MPPRKFFRIERDGDTLVVEVLREIPRLTDEDFEAELDHVEQELARPGLNNLVIDLFHVSYLESYTLNTMFALWKRVRMRGGKMALCSVPGLAREILEITNFDKLWPMCSSREEALALVKS